MFRATQKHCTGNAAIIQSIPAFQAAVNSLNDKIAALIDTVQLEDLDIKGNAVDKLQAKKSLCRQTSDLAGPIAAYADANGNNILYSQASLSYSELFKTKDDQLAPRCQNIHDLALANQSALEDYGVSADAITTLQNTIQHYHLKAPDPRYEAAQKITIRANLKKLVDEIDHILKFQLDKTIATLKANYPDFVHTYKASRMIKDQIKTTTTLKGVIMSSADKSVIQGATILLVESNTQVTTNDRGEYIIKPIPSGTYSLNVTAPKHKETVLTQVIVKQGKINKQVNMLEPA